MFRKVLSYNGYFHLKGEKEIWNHEVLMQKLKGLKEYKKNLVTN